VLCPRSFACIDYAWAPDVDDQSLENVASHRLLHPYVTIAARRCDTGTGMLPSSRTRVPRRLRPLVGREHAAASVLL
jgi:hypothetical protein